MKISHDAIAAVREMMERNWSIAEMAAKLNLDYDDVRLIVDIINQVLS